MKKTAVKGKPIPGSKEQQQGEKGMVETIAKPPEVAQCPYIYPSAPHLRTNRTGESYLSIVIDTTGSMGNWIKALNTIIPQFVRITALTGAFKLLNIISYKDYSEPLEVVVSTGWASPSDPFLVKFAQEMHASGGGGHPEATKSALYHLMENLPPSFDADKDMIYILHLTDAPAHDESSRLDNEGTLEKKTLGVKFDWVELTKAMLAMPIAYHAFSDCKYNLYASLASSTQGFFVQANTAQLMSGLMDVFNGWFGTDETKEVKSLQLELKTKGKKTVDKEGDLVNSYNLVAKSTAANHVQLEASLSEATHRLDRDEMYRQLVFSMLADIIREDVMSLTINKVFGRIWRKICTMRKDPRRDELINRIEMEKKKLVEAKKVKFEAWLRESYNMLEEIEQDLQEMVTEGHADPNKGCIVFMRDINDTSEPADMIACIRNLAKTDMSYIRHGYARMSVNADMPYTFAKNQTIIPLGMSPGKIFMYILHLIAPGTKVGARRGQAILAMLALGTVLDEVAKQFLQRYKGTWLNWGIDAETNKAEIPENFQVRFLYLLKSNKEYLTEKEYEEVEKLCKLSLCQRIPEMMVTTTTENFTSMDGVRPDHHMNCIRCETSRPLSLIIPNLSCGYCANGGDGPKVIQIPEATFMVRCSKCLAFYSRDRNIHILGRSQCHECLNGGTPSHVTCSICKYDFVTYHGLPGGTCKPCSRQAKALKPTFAEMKLTVRQIFDENMADVFQLLGFQYQEGVSMNLMDMYRNLATCTPAAPSDFSTKEYVWNNKIIANMTVVFLEIQNAIESHSITLETCDLCCEAKPLSELGFACGRKGCQQRVCNDCGKTWYSENKIGHVINLRHCQCMFCSRAPSAKVVRRWWDDGALALTRNLPPMDPTKYYAWCIRCNQVKACADRACGVAGQAPRFTNFECEECEMERVAFETRIREEEEDMMRLLALIDLQTAEDMAQEELQGVMDDVRTTRVKEAACDTLKRCPMCKVPTIRYSGCNHMTCICGCHWCFECGGNFASEEIYTHMTKKHGRIYSNEVPDFNEDY